MMISQGCQLEPSSTAQALARMPGLDMPGAAWRLVSSQPVTPYLCSFPLYARPLPHLACCACETEECCGQDWDPGDTVPEGLADLRSCLFLNPIF